jgi:hypothetical protein
LAYALVFDSESSSRQYALRSEPKATQKVLQILRAAVARMEAAMQKVTAQ